MLNFGASKPRVKGGPGPPGPPLDPHLDLELHFQSEMKIYAYNLLVIFNRKRLLFWKTYGCLQVSPMSEKCSESILFHSKIVSKINVCFYAFKAVTDNE